MSSNSEWTTWSLVWRDGTPLKVKIEHCLNHSDYSKS